MLYNGIQQLSQNALNTSIALQTQLNYTQNRLDKDFAIN
jgi:hypothetical protein